METAKTANVRDWTPFGQYHYLILNLAYGGAWGGEKGVDDTCLPAKYLVDYVRMVIQFGRR